MNIRPKLNLAGLRIRANSPALLIGVGIVSTVAGVIIACKETTKLDEVKTRHQQRLDDIHAKYEEIEDKEELINPVDETEVAEVEKNDIRKETTIAYIKTGWDYVKLYAPAAGMVLLGLTSFLVSHRILNKRYLGALTLYNTEAAAFKRYRKNVIEQEGKEKDLDYFLGKGEKKTIEVKTVDDNGNEIVAKKQATIVDRDGNLVELSEQAVIFGSWTSEEWSSNEYYNRTFLSGQIDVYSNIMYPDNGFVSKNQFLNMIGIKQTDEGQWIGNIKQKPIIEFYERWVPAEDGGYEPMYIIDFENLEVIANRIDAIEEKDI